MEKGGGEMKMDMSNMKGMEMSDMKGMSMSGMKGMTMDMSMGDMSKNRPHWQSVALSALHLWESRLHIG